MARCRHGVWEPACAQCKPLQVHRDQLFQFDYPFKHNDTVPIRSKGHFERECRQRGLRYVGQEELVKRGQPYKPEAPKVDKQQVTEVVKAIRQSATPERVERHWRAQQRRQHG